VTLAIPLAIEVRSVARSWNFRLPTISIMQLTILSVASAACLTVLTLALLALESGREFKLSPPVISFILTAFIGVVLTPSLIPAAAILRVAVVKPKGLAADLQEIVIRMIAVQKRMRASASRVRRLLHRGLSLSESMSDQYARAKLLAEPSETSLSKLEQAVLLRVVRDAQPPLEPADALKSSLVARLSGIPLALAEFERTDAHAQVSISILKRQVRLVITAHLELERIAAFDATRQAQFEEVVASEKRHAEVVAQRALALIERTLDALGRSDAALEDFLGAADAIQQQLDSTVKRLETSVGE